MTLNCIIIDDEPLAIEVLERYISEVDEICLVAKFHNPIEGMSYLSSNDIDLVFLDIEMPGLTGIELVKNISSSPMFVFTTAYPQYALDGFDLNAIDYLVKPIAFPRFLRAVQKVKRLFSSQADVDRFIFVRSDAVDVKIKEQDICYIEGLKDYLKIQLVGKADNQIITLMNFSQMMDKLSDSFIRVHRSYIVNKNHVTGIKKGILILGKDSIPVGGTYKDSVFEKLNVGNS